MRRLGRWVGGVIVMVFPLLFAGFVQAAIIEVTSRPALGGNDFIDWSSKGLGPQPNPFALSSAGGLPITAQAVVGVGTASFLVTEQSAGWFGNFAPGAFVLFATDSLGGILTNTIGFGSPVRGAGAQIQPFFVPATFTATLKAFDSADNLLGTFSENGTSTSASDNSAIFLGVLSDTANISHILYSVLSIPSESRFALNRMDLVTEAAPSVPWPDSVILLGLGLVGLSGWRFRQTAAPSRGQ